MDVLNSHFFNPLKDGEVQKVMCTVDGIFFLIHNNFCYFILVLIFVRWVV